MSKRYHRLLATFLVFVATVSSPAASLPASQSWSLLMLRRLLRNPPALRRWSNRTSFCTSDPTPSLAVVCYDGSVTQLHISGRRGSPPLPRPFSLDSLVTTLARLPDLKVLSLTSLGLAGELPAKLSRLSKLEILDLSSNHLSGRIPAELSSLRSLQSLVLDHNSVSGEVPGWLGELPRLAVLSLQNNSLLGSIPASIQAAESLRIVRLAANNLSGEVPDLRRLANLQVLDLQDNSLASRFPPMQRKVVSVLLARNRFGGGIPPEIGTYYMLRELDVSANHFVGPFPAAPVLALPLLQRLNISENMFTGMLFRNMSCGDSLEVVDVSGNLLTGSLPECLARANVSYRMNCLGAAIEAQHQIGFCQNEALAVGLVLRQRQGRNRKSRAAIVATVIGSVLFGIMLIGVVFVLIVKQAWRKKLKGKPVRRVVVEHGSNASETPSTNARYASQTMKLGALGIAPYRVFSLEDLEAATSNFDSSSFMGEGSNGQMYRGRIQDGTMVAIRCLKLKRKYTSQSLTHHIELIAKLRHRHLASTLGHCLEYYLEDSTISRLFLVFEYIPNGTLRSHICEGIRGQKLTWSQRISVAIGVAKGIQFLHIGVVPGLFTNNVKTTNVLLDQNLVAKISSYNLPVLTDDISAELSSSNSANGAKGVNRRTRSNEKIDVYDFGMMLLEMIMGKPVASENVNMMMEQLHAILAVDGSARKKMVDPTVTRVCSDESLRTVTEICIRCLSKDPQSRPSVDDLLWNLQFAIQVQDASRGDSQSSDGSNSPYQYRLPVMNIN